MLQRVQVFCDAVLRHVTEDLSTHQHH